MREDNTDVMVRLIADRQARLRAHNRPQPTPMPHPPSRMRRVAGQLLIRLGEHIRGELRDASPTPARSRLATH